MTVRFAVARRFTYSAFLLLHHPHRQQDQLPLPPSLETSARGQGETAIPLPRRLLAISALPLRLAPVPAQLPRLDDPPLRLVDVVLVADGLDADAHAFLGEVDVAARHALLGGPADLDDALVDVVADDGEAADEDGEEYEGDQLPGGSGVLAGWACSTRALGRSELRG